MVGSHERQREKPNQLKEQKVKSLKFFKPTLALSLGLHPSFRSAVAGKPPGERNVYMYDSIQLPNTASSRTTSQVTWPNDNKAVGNCFHALIAGLRPASLILARRIAFPLVLLGAGLALIQPCAGQSGTWTPTGSLANTGSRTATLLPNGKVLVAGGYQRRGYWPPVTYFATAAELYDPASGTWAATGIPVIPFHSLTATLLPNGKVLVTGTTPLTYSAVAELYDPASGTWSATGSLRTAPTDHYTTTLLPNGKVVAVGGRSGDDASRERAELYNPASGTWSATGSLATGRIYHTATLLPNGKVLVAGGFDGFDLASAELYDPPSGTWSGTDDLNTARSGHTATLLPNGNVLVAGGNSGYLASAELYNTPASGPATNITNISTRASVQTGQGVAIAGFIVTGTAPKQVVVRGLGPTLTNYNVTGVLADPTLKLFDGSGTL